MGLFDYPEGATPLDLDEMDGLKFKHVQTRAELDHLEQANIQEGLKWLSRQKSPAVFDLQFLRKLHIQLFGQVWSWAGQYRRTGKNIGVDPVYINAHMLTLLDDVRYWVEHKTFPAIEIAMRYHHKLVYIHPFPNGNGRFSRIMADAMMESVFDLPAFDWTEGNDLQEVNERRKQYIKALQAADKDDHRLLFEFVGYE